MMRRTTMLALILGLSLPALAARPDHRGVPKRFVTGDHPQYDRDTYVVGVGSGSTFDEARARAAKSVAAQLQSQIRSRTVMSDEMATSRVDRDRSSSESTLYQSDVEMVAAFDRADLIQVADTHKNKRGVWVIAVLDKDGAAEKLKQDVQRRSGDIRSRLKAFGTDGPPGGVQADLRDVYQRARQEWALLSAVGQGGDYPSELSELEAMMSSYGSTDVSLSLCVFDGGKTSRDLGLADQLLITSAEAKFGWGRCDRDAGTPVLNGPLSATVTQTDEGWQCETEVKMRFVDTMGRESKEIDVGGVLTRADGDSAEAACKTSIVKLLPRLRDRAARASGW